MAECWGGLEYTAQAQLPLSVSTDYVYTITNHNAPSAATNCNDPNVYTWCECGTDYTDNAARCNTPGEVVMMHLKPTGCAVSSATLTYQVSTWGGPASVDIRRILRPVTAPPMGQPGQCVSSSVASWFRAGSQAWAGSGASVDGLDRSAAGVGKAYPGQTGVRTESFDVTALVSDQCVNGCVLAQYASGAHVNVLTNTVNLTYDCAVDPAVCGDGVIEGVEACDDGNVTNGDGCSACAVDPGYTCTGEPSACVTTCGDGIVAGAEQCDLGAQNGPNSVCSAACVSQQCETTCQ